VSKLTRSVVLGHVEGARYIEAAPNGPCGSRGHSAGSGHQVARGKRGTGMSLSGRNAAVAGGASGMGLAICERLAPGVNGREYV
jgi:hypothetical protein